MSPRNDESAGSSESLLPQKGPIGSRASPPPSSEDYGTFTPINEYADENKTRGERNQFGFVREDGNLVQRILWKVFRPPVIPTRRGHYTANVISQCLFSWPFHLVWAATTRQLDINDIDSLDPRHHVGTKGPEFMYHLNRHAVAGSRRPLMRAIFSTYRYRILLTLFLSLAAVILNGLSIFSLRWIAMALMSAYTHPGDHNPRLVWDAVLLGLMLGAVTFANGLAKTHSTYQAQVIGAEVRTLLSSCMYSKSMRISHTAVRPSARETGGQESGELDLDEEDIDGDLENYEDCCNPDPAKLAKKKRWYHIFGPGKKKTAVEAHKVASAATGDTDTGPAQLTQHASDVYWTEGPIINSMSVDTQRIEAAIARFHDAWSFFLALPGFFPVAWYFFSWPGVVGGIVLIVTLPLLGMAAGIVSRRRQSVNRLSELRANLVMDILQGVRFLKMFAWEQIFLQRFHRIRSTEASRLRGVQVASVVGVSMSFTLSRFTVVVANGLYRAFVGDLDKPYDVIPYLCLLGDLSSLYRRVLGASGMALLIALPSIRNVQDLLLAQEEEPGLTFSHVEDHENAVELGRAEFSWFGHATGCQHSDENSLAAHQTVAGQDFRLQPLTLSIRASELIAVVGPVASGKSSLASGLVGDMSHVGGHVGLDLSTVAYCAQAPWIQNATVRENIIFGRPLDLERYERVVSACALDRDIRDEFHHGDATELGERGITVSGGQKSRIQLARTIYGESDIVILDDPLSAVDARTASHIFGKAILGELSNKCRILITHQLHVLPRCDRVVWMENGNVLAVDTYAVLMARYPAFARWVGRSAAHKPIPVAEAEKAAEDTCTASQSSGSGALENSVLGKAGSVAGLMVAEDRATDAVPWTLYLRYLTLATPGTAIIIHYLILAFSQVANQVYFASTSIWSARLWNLPEWMYPTIMAGSLCLHSLSWSYFYVSLQDDFIQGSRALVGGAIERLFRAPMSFFDTNPLGRILNRFTQDVSTMDTKLPGTAWDASLCLFAMLSLVVTIALGVPVSAFVFLPWAAGIWLVLWIYKRSPLELERLEKLSQSRFVATLAEGVNGRSCLVSTGRVGEFRQRLHENIDELNSIHFSAFSAHAWVDVRAALMASLLTTIVTLLLVQRRNWLHPSIGTWLLTNCPAFTSYMTSALESMADMQKGMTGVQRLDYYRTQLPGEEARHLPPGEDAGRNWPMDGSIVVRKAYMRYRPDLPFSLRNLDLVVKSGERVGVVGRTGAGKSSLAAILLRTVDIESGHIIISGVDTATIGLHPLRRAIAIIPQDPTLFLGTIRRNLDPTARDRNPDPVADVRLEAALRTVGLIHDHDEAGAASAPSSSTLPGAHHVTLDTKVETGGRNFSHGVRQLLALARALVRDTRVILIDEATSSVDSASDARIQETVRRELAGKTIIAIAHRVRTILSYDKVCVMDKGRVAEFGAPRDMWTNPHGLFRELCDASKITVKDFSQVASFPF